MSLESSHPRWGLCAGSKTKRVGRETRIQNFNAAEPVVSSRMMAAFSSVLKGWQRARLARAAPHFESETPGQIAEPVEALSARQQVSVPSSVAAQHLAMPKRRHLRQGQAPWRPALRYLHPSVRRLVWVRP